MTASPSPKTATLKVTIWFVIESMNEGLGRYRLGEFTLEFSTGMLHKGANAVRLSEQTFAVLKFLLTHHDLPLPAEQLLTAAWNDPDANIDEVQRTIQDTRRSPGSSVFDLIHGGEYKVAPPPSQVRSVPAVEALPGHKAQVVFLFSHNDSRLRDDLEKHISLLKRQGEIERWLEGGVSAGKPLDREILKHLEKADLVLLLVSAEFLGSDYCWSREMLRAIERHETGAATVIPIILRPCDWHSAPFGKLRPLPTDGKAITSSFWANTDTAFVEVVKGVRTALEVFRSGHV